MASRSPELSYQLHIQLADILPPIWRKILVPGSVTLSSLHQILQVVMGWENYHLHQFIVGTTSYGEPDPEYDNNLKSHRHVRLRQIGRATGDRFIYEYDFGDSWRHEIIVESIEPQPEDSYLLRCLDGARACPPEDCGGVSGYEHLLEALRDRRHPEHHELREWVGKQYDPALFSLQAINSALAMLITLRVVRGG